MGMIMHDDVPYGEGTSYTQGTGIVINNNVIAVDADNTPTSGSEKPVKSKGVYSALESNSAKSASLLKSTVGWTGKNLLPNTGKSKTANGVTFIVNSDGSILANGTSTGWAFVNYDNFLLKAGIYKMTGVPNVTNACFTVTESDESIIIKNLVGGTDEVEFTLDVDTIISVRVGTNVSSGVVFDNSTFYPMLRDASITDDTYEPYHESVEEEVEQIYAKQRVLGAKNLLPNNATSQTINGVTFTVNADGSVTVNGTASAKTDLIIKPTSVYNNDEDVIINGCPSGGSINTYKLGAWDETASAGYSDFGNGFTLPRSVSGHRINIAITVYNGATVNNVTFKPMLRLASDPDDTYVPYAMTNRDITEELTVQESAVTDIIEGASVGSGVGNHLYKYGKVVQLLIRVDNVTVTAWTDIIGKIPVGFRPRNEMRVGNLYTIVPTNRIAIMANGKIYCTENITNEGLMLNTTWITD